MHDLRTDLCVFTFGIHILKRVNGLKLGKFHQLEKTKKQLSTTLLGGAVFNFCLICLHSEEIPGDS